MGKPQAAARPPTTFDDYVPNHMRRGHVVSGLQTSTNRPRIQAQLRQVQQLLRELCRAEQLLTEDL